MVESLTLPPMATPPLSARTAGCCACALEASAEDGDAQCDHESQPWDHDESLPRRRGDVGSARGDRAAADIAADCDPARLGLNAGRRERWFRGRREIDESNPESADYSRNAPAEPTQNSPVLVVAKKAPRFHFPGDRVGIGKGWNDRGKCLRRLCAFNARMSRSMSWENEA